MQSGLYVRSLNEDEPHCSLYAKPPTLHQVSNFHGHLQAIKPIGVQTFLPNLGIKCFNEGIIGWFTRSGCNASRCRFKLRTTRSADIEKFTSMPNPLRLKSSSTKQRVLTQRQLGRPILTYLKSNSAISSGR